jgi:hypothetical protein
MPAKLIGSACKMAISAVDGRSPARDIQSIARTANRSHDRHCRRPDRCQQHLTTAPGAGSAPSCAPARNHTVRVGSSGGVRAISPRVGGEPLAAA